MADTTEICEETKDSPETEITEEVPIVCEAEPKKPKKMCSEKKLESLKKAREKAAVVRKNMTTKRQMKEKSLEDKLDMISHSLFGDNQEEEEEVLSHSLEQTKPVPVPTPATSIKRQKRVFLEHDSDDDDNDDEEIVYVRRKSDTTLRKLKERQEEAERQREFNQLRRLFGTVV